MKRQLLLAALAACAAPLAGAHAQALRVGLKAGPTLSNFAGKHLTSSYRLAAHAGLVANVPVSELLAVQPELLFSMKGDQNKNFGLDIHTNLSYLELPVLLRVKAGGLFFEAGPQIGLLLSAKYKANELTLKTTSYYHTLDLGAAAGLGYQLPGGLHAGLRYSTGFRDPVKDPLLPGSGVAARGRNNVFQLYVGYLLPGL